MRSLVQKGEESDSTMEFSNDEKIEKNEEKMEKKRAKEGEKGGDEKLKRNRQWEI